jgi:two-component system cell cycle response regulator CtrA
MNSILLIEDDPTTAAAMQAAFLEAGYYTDVTDNMKDAFEAAQSREYSVIVQDIVLKADSKSGMSGGQGRQSKQNVLAYNLIWKMRSAKIKTPIVIVSALWALESKIRSLGFGADDYIVKPYHITELIARIQAVIRRFRGLESSVCKVGPLSIHLDSKEVYCKGQPVILTGKEYAILEILATRNGIVPKEAFLNNLYGGVDEPEIKIIDVFVCKLRKKLVLASNGIDFIQTVWGRGYQLNRNVKSDDKKGDESSGSESGVARANSAIFANHELDGLTSESFIAGDGYKEMMSGI